MLLNEHDASIGNGFHVVVHASLVCDTSRTCSTCTQHVRSVEGAANSKVDSSVRHYDASVVLRT